MKAQGNEEIQEQFRQLTPEAQRLVVRVLELERKKLHMGRAHGIVKDLLVGVRETVK